MSEYKNHYSVDMRQFDSSQGITIQTIVDSFRRKFIPLEFPQVLDWIFKEKRNPIPKGCGRNQVSMSIENQTTRTEFYYELPSVKSCSISFDQMISCIGNFAD
ncbi:hypothetical protein ACTFIY_007315 [Dictyostelium cf. discoideum]